MRQIRRIHIVNVSQARFSISDEMLEELKWKENAELVGEVGKDNQLIVINDPKQVRCRLNLMPRYNVITIPRVWGEKYNKHCRLESSEDGRLVVKFFE